MKITIFATAGALVLLGPNVAAEYMNPPPDLGQAWDPCSGSCVTLVCELSDYGSRACENARRTIVEFCENILGSCPLGSR